MVVLKSVTIRVVVCFIYASEFQSLLVFDSVWVLYACFEAFFFADGEDCGTSGDQDSKVSCLLRQLAWVVTLPDILDSVVEN